jgi:hypothetical protein
MGDTEKRMWRDRSADADMLWRERGLVGENEGEAFGTDLVRVLDAYRGDQWKHTGWLNGIDTDSHLVINSMFSAANTLAAQHLARSPRAQVFGRTAESAATASSFEKLLNWALREVRAYREWNRTIFDAFFRVGFTRVGYTPPDETHDARGRRAEFLPTRSDLPWLRRVAPWDIRIDPDAESWHADGGATWCEFISLHTKEQLQRMPKVTVPRDLTATISKARREMRDRRNRDRLREITSDLVEVRTVYDLAERKWFQWSPGSERLLREPDDWPRVFDGIEGLPYAMLAFNEPADDACPVGYADMVWPLQVERNKVRTMLSELVRRHRRIIIANEAAFEGSEKEKLADGEVAEMYFANGEVGQAIRDIPVAGMDQGLLLYDSAIQEDIRETIGQSKMARAQRINVETATEAQRVGAGDDLQAGRNQVSVEDWLRETTRLFAGAVQALPNDAAWTIPVLGQRDAAQLAAGQPPVLRVTGDEIAGEYLFDIETGSSQPRNENTEIAKSLQWVQIAQQFPQNVNIMAAITELALALDKDPARALLTAQQSQAATAAAQQQGTPTEESGGGVNPAPFLPGGGGGGLQ